MLHWLQRQSATQRKFGAALGACVVTVAIGALWLQYDRPFSLEATRSIDERARANVSTATTTNAGGVPPFEVLQSFIGGIGDRLNSDRVDEEQPAQDPAPEATEHNTGSTGDVRRW